MLYDPAPLNNPNDPVHDMSKYVGLLAEGTFQYRRSLVEIDDTGSMGKRWDILDKLSAAFLPFFATALTVGGVSGLT